MFGCRQMQPASSEIVSDEPAASVVARPPTEQLWVSSWQSLEVNPSWEAQLAKLKDYKAEHGDCNVPKGWVEDPPLGNWVGTQRTGKKKLDRGKPCGEMTAERALKLDALGFAWVASKIHPDDAKWEAQLGRLAAYRAAHGDCKVPRGWAEDPRLGVWVNHQRAHKKKLDRGEYGEGMTVQRAAKLEALGVIWEGSYNHPDDTKWEAQLARLAAYKAAHGDCKVPWGWTEDQPLAMWVSRQRSNKRKLDNGEPSLGMTAERVVKLDALGFVWKLWEAQPNKLGNNSAAVSVRLKVKRLESENAACDDTSCSDGPTGPETLRYFTQQLFICHIVVIFVSRADNHAITNGSIREPRIADITNILFMTTLRRLYGCVYK
jgi:hypothetical protein